MIVRDVPITEKTRVGTIRNGLKLVMRIEMIEHDTGRRYYEERWSDPSQAVALAHPAHGFAQWRAEWAAAVKRSRGGA